MDDLYSEKLNNDIEPITFPIDLNEDITLLQLIQRFIGKFYFHASPPGLCGYFNPSIPWVSPMAIDMQALRAGV